MLSANKRRALAAQLSTPSRRAAAKKCGLSESALTKYNTDPEYLAALDAGREEQLREAIQSLTASTGAAVEALRHIMTDPSTQAMPKIAAARALLEFALRFTENAGAATASAAVFIDDVPKKILSPPALAEISTKGGETNGNESNGFSEG